MPEIALAVPSGSGAPTETAAPAQPATSEAELTAYGQEQVGQLLLDRPQLAAIIVPGGEIEKWLVKAFAAPELGYRIVWKSAATTAGADSPAQSSAYPDWRGLSYITVDGIWKSGPNQGTARSAEEVLSSLVYELGNVRMGRERAALNQQTLFGQVTRKDYILRQARFEYDALRNMTDFHDRVWVPFCHASGRPDVPQLWRLDTPGTFVAWLKSYPPSNWYPWEFYGKCYDTIQSKDYPHVLAKAQSGDPIAQAETGSLLAWVGLYKDSFDWYWKAANQGNVEGEMALAYCFFYGTGTEKDDAKSFAWGLKGAQQGNATCEKMIAWHFRYGVGVAADPVQAKFWDDKAAAQK